MISGAWRNGTSFGLKDLEARNTVIQTAIWTAKGTKQSKAFQQKVRYLTVWVKKGDRWVVTAEQSTPIAGDR